MKKFVVMYYAPVSAQDQMKNATPEQAAEGMKPWMDWKEKVGDGMVDMGTPLGNSRKVTKDGASPSGSNIVGYSVLQANSMDDALEMVKEHPHLQWTNGCEIEVHESLPLPGM